VPKGPGPAKFNLVRLTDGQGLSVRPLPGAQFKAEEIKGVLNFFAWSQMLQGLPPSDRVFMISGIVPSTTGVLQAMDDQRRIALDTLQVAVLKPRTVKLSIRPIQVRSPQGALVNHSKEPVDANAMVDQMNAIWTPQANVVFTLVSSTPAQLTDEARIAKILRLSAPTAPLPQIVNKTLFNDLLTENKDKNADLTMFLVERASIGPQTNAQIVNGATLHGTSLISDSRAKEPLLMAHEAGHFLGNDSGHTDEPDPDGTVKDKRKQLMVTGGATLGYSLVPFDLAIALFNRQ
jgi:hypothetical protein